MFPQLYLVKYVNPSESVYHCQMETVSASISPAQRRVLEALKRVGEATADELAGTLEISSSALRQHLSALRSAGLIAAHQERGHPGRPAQHYRATEGTEQLFVTAANTLSTELLGHIHEEDPDLVNRIFERRRRDQVEAVRDGLSAKSVDERVLHLTELLDTQGYLADCETLDPNHYRINLHSCPIWAVASQYPQACTNELEFLRELLPEANVERVTHKTAGAHSCAYEICVQDWRASTSESPLS